MKKIISILAISFVYLTFAQSQQGTVKYQYKMNMNDFKMEVKGEDPTFMKSIEESVKKAFDKNYILDFDGKQSLFYEEIKLDVPKQSAFAFNIGNAEKSYKNLDNQEEIEEKEFFSKEFLVAGELKKWNWQITQESKQIGQYTCIKATLIIPVTDEEKETIKKLKESQKDSKFQFGEIPDPKDKEVVAWFTPEIPIGHGPREFWGLPGLILELHKDKETFLATQITINPKTKIKIKKPNKGKKVSKVEFEKIQKDDKEIIEKEIGNDITTLLFCL
jgi:GLPGLI family protein